MLVRDGAVYTDPTGTPPSGRTRKPPSVRPGGRHAIIVTLDGRFGEATASGVSPAQVAGYLLQVAPTARCCSTVAARPAPRAPGDSGCPSKRRPMVSNGRWPTDWFIYHQRIHARRCSKVVSTRYPGDHRVLGDRAGSVYASDRDGNPAARHGRHGAPEGARRLVRRPARGAPVGRGEIVARAGGVVTSQPLRVIDRLASLAVSSNQPDLTNRCDQAFALSGTTAPARPRSPCRLRRRTGAHTAGSRHGRRKRVFHAAARRRLAHGHRHPRRTHHDGQWAVARPANSCPI